jgi:hypothetical protein
MVLGQGIYAALHIGEVLQEKPCHIRIDSVAIRHWSIDAEARPRSWHRPVVVQPPKGGATPVRGQRTMRRAATGSRNKPLE